MAMQISPRLAIWKQLAVHSVWLAVALVSLHISRLCGKIEIHAVNLLVCSSAYETKSGSKLHDSRISAIYRSNYAGLRKSRDSFLGGVAYWITMARHPALQRYTEGLSEPTD